MEGIAMYPIFVVVIIAFYPLCLSKPTSSLTANSLQPGPTTSKTLLQNATERWKQEKCEITPKKVETDHADDVTTTTISVTDTDDYSWLRYCNVSDKASRAFKLCHELIQLSSDICSKAKGKATEERNQMMKNVTSSLKYLVLEDKTDICDYFKKLEQTPTSVQKKLAPLIKQYPTIEHLMVVLCSSFCSKGDADGESACKYFYILTAESLGLPLPQGKANISEKNLGIPSATSPSQPSDTADVRDGSRFSGEAKTVQTKVKNLPLKTKTTSFNKSDVSGDDRTGSSAEKEKAVVTDKHSTMSTGTSSVNGAGSTSQNSSAQLATNNSTTASHSQKTDQFKGTLGQTQLTGTAEKPATRKPPSPEGTGNPIENKMTEKPKNPSGINADQMLTPTTTHSTKERVRPITKHPEEHQKPEKMTTPSPKGPVNMTPKTNSNTGLKSTTTTSSPQKVMTTSAKNTPNQSVNNNLKPTQEVMAASTQKTSNELDIKTTILTTLSTTKDILSDGDIELEDDSSYSDGIALDGGQFNGGGGFLGTQEKSEDVPLEPIFEGTGKKNRFLNTKQETRINPIVPKQEVESSHFMAYFLTIMVVCIVGYVLFHNKQKIIAFILEGRGNQRRRATGGAEYQKVSTNVDEALPAADKKVTTQNYIY